MSESENIVKTVAEAPAIALDKTIKTSESFVKTVQKGKATKEVIAYWHTLGPGLTTGAADDDPSGITTYSQQGAQTGYQLLWLAGFTFPLMAVVQEMCARIGIITNKGLAANIRKYYPKWFLYIISFLLLGANSLNLGADIGAMAKAVQLIIPNMNFVFLVFGFTIIILALQIYTTYKVYAKYLKWLALVLFAYVFSALSIKGINWGNVLFHTLMPQLTLTRANIYLITAILGTTISPYLFFWQTSQECEERLAQADGRELPPHLEQTDSAINHDLKRMRIDVWSGMFISNLVMFFIVVTTAATLFSHGITNIGTAADAAAALRPIAGDYAYLLFAIGIIGAGLLAVPILAGSASYALSETFRWRTSLSRKLKDAYAFYGVIIIAMLIGLVINFLGLDPIKMLIFSAAINGIIAPLILIFIVKISGSREIMGKYKNNMITRTLGWLTVIIMSVAAIGTVLFSFFNI